MTTATEVLNRAREIIERDGWSQGDYKAKTTDDGDEATPVCALGAINRAVSGRADIFAGPGVKPGVYTEVMHRLGSAIDRENVAYWNDDPHRTVEDVVLAFKRAAEGA